MPPAASRHSCELRVGEGGHLIEVQCFHTLEAAAYLRAEVNALNLASPQPDPFSTFEFFENLMRHDESAAAGRRLWFLCAFVAGRLFGYLVLKQVMYNVLGWRTSGLAFFVTHDNDRPHAVARSEHLTQASEAFYAYLLGRKREWSFLEFQQQDDRSSLFPPPAVIRKGLWVRCWPNLENGTIHIRWGTLREYFSALSSKSRSNISRQMRSLFAAGEVELLASSDPAITPLLFELYCSMEPRSWKSQTNASIGRHPERIAYFRGLLDAQQPMRVSIQLLLLDGVPIAGLICGGFMNGLYALHIVYDDRLSQIGPGSAILLMGMRQAIDGSFGFFNLLSGFGYYKSRWLAEITETRALQIYRVGGTLFWRRVLGDWRRRLFPARSGKAPMLFNPARRGTSGRESERTEPGMMSNRQSSAEEKTRFAALTAEARKGGSEFLTAAELAALMPFDTKRVSRNQGR